ncbi:unnamed protein product [Knipowitschia caucasica]
MELDPTILLPALLCTAVALYFASSYLGKKSAESSSAAQKKKPKVGYGDEVPPSRALGVPRAEPQPQPKTVRAEPAKPAEVTVL